MPKHMLKKWHSSHQIALFIVAFIFMGILAYFQWEITLFGFIILAIIFFFNLRAKREFERELIQYISTLSHRINTVNEEAITNLPFGVVLYNEDKHIQWLNSYISSFFEEEPIGKTIESVFEKLEEDLKEEKKEFHYSLHDKTFKVIHDEQERLLYFFDITEEQLLKEQYEQDRTVVGYLYIDNYQEVTQGMDEQLRSKLLSRVTTALNRWSREHDILLRRTAADRFITVFNEKTLQTLEEDRFTILDEVREETAKEQVTITLSFGIGSKASTLTELGNLAQSSLDLALVRGGDQVAIKRANGEVRFYGGKSSAIEKRTRVRARVISHAIRDFIIESEQVFIMGHKNPDLDSIGSSIGMLKIAEANGKEGYIVIDFDDVNVSVQKLLDSIKDKEELWAKFISPAEALDKVTRKTLLTVVDTHRPSLVIEPKLLDDLDRIIVIDHHRRGEEFIDHAALVYMEPYASSTAELVTELLEYQPKQPKLDVLEATALLSGIIVDTKSFVIRTGSRTFDAASYLKSKGADTTLVQRFMKEDLDQYIKRAKLIENTYIYSGGMAIAKGLDDHYDQLIIAQAADTLLTMNDVIASFVISPVKDGRISISARSLGEVNVQVIMEALGGGGHLTNAAAQLENVSMDEAEQMLKDKIDDYFGGGKSK